ncbi:hypothetical protein HG530_012357 [Fusarium avenaceum]|nr:hypothetical protein HG530_012357 [Fusarium avenaceum]
MIRILRKQLLRTANSSSPQSSLVINTPLKRDLPDSNTVKVETGQLQDTFCVILPSQHTTAAFTGNLALIISPFAGFWPIFRSTSGEPPFYLLIDIINLDAIISKGPDCNNLLAVLLLVVGPEKMLLIACVWRFVRVPPKPHHGIGMALEGYTFGQVVHGENRDIPKIVVVRVRRLSRFLFKPVFIVHELLTGYEGMGIVGPESYSINLGRVTFENSESLPGLGIDNMNIVIYRKSQALAIMAHATELGLGPVLEGNLLKFIAPLQLAIVGVWVWLPGRSSEVLLHSVTPVRHGEIVA